MKKSLLMIVSLAVFVAVIPNRGFTSGIPVFDASSMINQLRDLLQQIMIYEEAISQNTQLTQQYYQMLRDYQLKLTRFRHYLNQLQSVRHMISQKDWLRILQTIKYYYGKSKRAGELAAAEYADRVPITICADPSRAASQALQRSPSLRPE